MPYTMYVVASTLAENVDDEERLLSDAKDKLGTDWIVTFGEDIPDAPAA